MDPSATTAPAHTREAAAAPTAIARPLKLAHVVLRSGRFREAIEWWQTVLGARVVHEGGPLCFLTYDDEHHRLALIDMGDVEPAPRGGAGLEHIAFSYATLDDLVSTYERLHEAGIEPHWCINHGMTVSLYYADPDGAQCELQVDLCTPDEADEFMTSSTFAANPLGVEFDPAELARQHRAGEEPAALALYGPRAAS